MLRNRSDKDINLYQKHKNISIVNVMRYNYKIFVPEFICIIIILVIRICKTSRIAKIEKKKANAING